MSRLIQHGAVKFWWVAGDIPRADEAAKTQVISRTATGGTVVFSSNGEPTTAIGVTASTTAAQIKTALLALDGVDTGDLDVTGATGGPFTASGDFSDISVDATGATGGTVTVAAPTPRVVGGLFQPSLATHFDFEITEAIRSTTGWAVPKADVDVPDLLDGFPKTIPGLPQKSNPGLMIYQNDSPSSIDAQVVEALIEDAVGTIIRSTSGMPEVADKVEVWPARVMSADPTADTDATSAAGQLVDVKFSLPASRQVRVPVLA